jgi:hypothetical protein
LATAALSFLPMLGYFVESLGVVLTGGSWASSEPRSPVVANVAYTLFAHAAGFSLGPSVAELHHHHDWGTFAPYLPVIGLVAFVNAVVLLFGLKSLPQQLGRNGVIVCFTGILAPILAALLLASFFRFQVRYVIVATPFLDLLGALGLAYLLLRHRVLGRLTLVAMCGLAGWSLVNLYTDSRYAKEDVRAAVARWRAHSPREPILSNSYFTVERYLTANEGRWHSELPGIGSPVSEIEKILARMGSGTAWVVIVRDWDRREQKRLATRYAIIPVSSAPIITAVRIREPSAAPGS